tara:strand:+ start:483 stop:818 length:336 start_codon:yes stop_codon:yes gene_type:complete
MCSTLDCQCLQTFALSFKSFLNKTAFCLYNVTEKFTPFAMRFSISISFLNLLLCDVLSICKIINLANALFASLLLLLATALVAIRKDFSSAILGSLLIDTVFKFLFSILAF